MKNLALPLIIILCVLIVSITTITIKEFTEINNNRIILLDLYQLKHDVLSANLYMRNATIPDSIEEREKELAKMLITRQSATNVYKNLNRSVLTPEQTFIVKTLVAERVEYRECQNRTVYSIRHNPDSVTWKYFIDYNVYLNRYLHRVDFLIYDINKKMEHSFKFTKDVVEIISIVSLFCLFILILLLIKYRKVII